MKYALGGIGIVYAALCMFAAAVQMKSAKKKDAPAMMLGGGFLFALGACMYLAAVSFSWIITAIGGALICIAAFLNGKRGEKLQISHHVIRLAVTALLVAGFSLL